MDRLDESRIADLHTFSRSGLRFDPATGVAELDFTHQGDGRRLHFTEVIDFPLPDGGPDPGVLGTFSRVLELLHVAVGTVYYKAVAPPRVDLRATPLAPAAARWAEQLYRRGLAEFAYRWGLEHVLEVPVGTSPGPPSARHDDHAAPGRVPLLAMGGGRDSIVALEALTGAGFAPATFTVSRDTTASGGRGVRGPGPFLPVRRRPDPVMARLVRENVLRIGHAPVTAVNSLAGVALAVLHGLGPVVMANERSADEGNMVWRGHPVNHQWSKSRDAEQLLDAAVREHAGVATACFSLLRGMSELTISRLFAATTAYDGVLTSCNVAARSPGDGTRRWCNDCAKCRFVFLGLAPFMEPDRLVGIFGRNLLADPAQIGGYRELAGLTAHKPFECVGEVAEARVAVAMLADDPRWRDAEVTMDLVARLPPVPASAAAAVWRVVPADGAPPPYRDALDQLSSAVPQGGS